mmetsp:Transcript_1869/g.2567  ORF Transcript_1869/g.2567 Transcript_1869/m.2567 type:complete len:91 (+) Transcript_1869:1364-1636(+)
MSSGVTMGFFWIALRLGMMIVEQERYFNGFEKTKQLIDLLICFGALPYLVAAYMGFEVFGKIDKYISTTLTLYPVLEMGAYILLYQAKKW